MPLCRLLVGPPAVDVALTTKAGCGGLRARPGYAVRCWQCCEAPTGSQEALVGPPDCFSGD